MADLTNGGVAAEEELVDYEEEEVPEGDANKADQVSKCKGRIRSVSAVSLLRNDWNEQSTYIMIEDLSFTVCS